MNILHLLSQNHLTGAEVYAVTLGLEQKRQGHEVHQISNDFFFPSDLILKKVQVETRSKLRFILNLIRLRSYLRRNQIALVHSHSRAAAKLAYWATFGTSIAYVSTIHGVQHSSASKKIFNQYGQFMIGVCENIQNHLLKDFNYRAELIRVIRNPINTRQFYFSEKNNFLEAQSPKKIFKVGIVGRTTGPKKERTEQILRTIFEIAESTGQIFEITLVGGKKSDLALIQQKREMILEVQAEQLNTAFYENYDLVVGSGRVCMESLLSGVPTIAFGEALYIGLIRNALFFAALRSNFGDIDQGSKNGPRLNKKQFEEDLQSVLKNEITIAERKILSEKAVQEFSIEHIANKVKKVYQSALFLKKHPYSIPVLMYHKIPISEVKSQHKIYVLKENFEKHLQFFQKNNFQTLTFSQLEKFKTGEIDFKEFPKKPLILTFDDGYRDNLENASPLLKKYNFTAQIFLLADATIKSNEWDTSATEPSHEIICGDDRKHWVLSAFEIGSHGFTHKRITEMSDEDAFLELKNSKISLENEFQTRLNVFAFTYGDTNKKMAQLAEAAGYSYAVNTDQGGFFIEESPYEIFRTSIFPNETGFSLFKKTSTWYRRYYYWKRKK